MLEQVISNRAGWTRVAFGDVVRKVSDKVDPWESGLERYVAGDHMDTDDLRIRRWGLIGDDYLGPAFHMRFKPGHVLYGSRRTYLRKVALADFEGITANTTYVLETKDPKVLMPELLPFIMQTEAFHAHSIAQSKGSTNPYVNFSDIASFEFDLPPIQEQARLRELVASFEGYREALLTARSAQEEMLRSFLEHEWDPFAKNWKKVRTGDLLEVVSGGTPSRGKKEYWGGDIPWVRTGEVNYRTILATEERITEIGLKNSSARLVPAGTVLVALFGQGPTLGRAAILGIEATTNQACACIIPNASVDSGFLYYFLKRQYLRLRSLARGANQPNLNLAIIKDLEIPFPPISEQISIREKAEKIEENYTEISKRLEQLWLLRSKINSSLSGDN